MLNKPLIHAFQEWTTQVGPALTTKGYDRIDKAWEAFKAGAEWQRERDAQIIRRHKVDSEWAEINSDLEVIAKEVERGE